jgi:rubrerythrin
VNTNDTPQSLTEATAPVRKSGSPAVIAKSDLSQPEADRLQQLESVIDRGKQAFIEVGTALVEIRVNRLYRSEFKTFEEYCQSKWGFSRQFANKTIESSGIASDLETTVSISNERTAREFISVPAEDRPAVAEQAKAIAAEQGRDTINSRDVKEAKAKRKAGPVYHCAECRNTFTESDGDCPRCHPPEPETVEFVQAEDHDFELTFAVVCGSFSRRVFDARSHWTPDQVKRLKTEIDAFFSCEVPPEYREAL